MKSIELVLTLAFATACLGTLSSCCCRKPEEKPAGGVYLMSKGPDGELHTVKVRDLTAEEAAQPVTTVITTGKKP